MAGSTKGELRKPESPAAHALDPRRRKFRERCGGQAREASGCLRRAFVRSHARARSAAVRAGCDALPLGSRFGDGRIERASYGR